MTPNPIITALDQYADSITQAAITIQEARLKYNAAQHQDNRDEINATRMLYAGAIRVNHDRLLVDIQNLNNAMITTQETIQ